MEFIRRFAELGRDDVDAAGGKGANLGELTRAGLPVPPGFVLTTAAYRAFVESSGIGEQVLALASVARDAEPAAYEEPSRRIRALFASAAVPEEVSRELLAARAELDDGPVAVRSSATAEDLEGASFAGQQDTFLNVRGTDALLDAVRDCWASLWTARAMAYRGRQGIDAAAVALAVVVQEMVDADAAGVMFTANPTTGRRDEAVVAAAWGLGEAVVGGSVTTDDVVVEKATGRVRSRATADKTVMTAAVQEGSDHGTEERPVPAEKRARPVLDDADAAALVGLGSRIEEWFGAPQDIEWARAGDGFSIVQSRPITALPEPSAAPPTDWSVPDPTAFYVRASIVEQLPDPLSPLFAELVDGSVTRSLRAMMGEILGDGDLVGPGDVALPTVNGYAYYRYSRSGMARIMRRTPRAFWVVARRGGAKLEDRWREQAHPRYVRTVECWTARPVDSLTVAELLTGVEELLYAGTAYYTAVQTIIPLAASSEVAFTGFYERLVRRPGDPAAATYLLGFDSAPIRAEQSLYDLALWTRSHPGLADALLAASPLRTAALFQAAEVPAGVDPAVWGEWCARFQAHLDAHGHTVYNLDFAAPVPADDPAPLIGTLQFYLRGGGTDPAQRQMRTAQRREEATATVLARLDPLRRGLFSRLLSRAQAAAPLREDALADVGLGWPQLRRMLREVGCRLAAFGTIERWEDVFWLRRAEIVAQPSTSLVDVVDERRALWRGERQVTPPQVLPRGSWWGKAFGRWLPATSVEQTGAVLRGTAASAGQVTATARVLGGPQDFGRMQAGDVLVASITTPAWTSLFAMASGVVTDIGGPLSHSSIVAREYGIPAVLGTAVATRRIPDGARVRVDGDAGTVTVLDSEPAVPGGR
jgi:phosphohistidine swiveling domain-containing protein